VTAVNTQKPGYRRGTRIALQIFLITAATAWMIPLVGAFYSSFRYFRADTLRNGVFSAPQALTLDNYRDAWVAGNIGRHFLNTMFIVVPSLVITLFLASLVAFVCTRFSWRFNVFFLVLFTAGNLMPHQVAFQPLFQTFKRVPWPDVLSDTNTGSLLGTKVGVILIHIAFQTGFCTFVLSNYMKTIPKEITEAAMVDGASMSRQFFQVILPLCRPALAALGTLLFTWLYNDFFWGSVMIQQAIERPITSSIAVLNGQWTVDYNLIAAASMMIALPTLAVFIALQKQFIGGLTLGSSKG
jgi:multiple sugar transport system permease protein